MIKVEMGVRGVFPLVALFALMTAATAQRSVVFVHGILASSEEFVTMEPWIKQVSLCSDFVVCLSLDP